MTRSSLSGALLIAMALGFAQPGCSDESSGGTAQTGGAGSGGTSPDGAAGLGGVAGSLSDGGPSVTVLPVESKALMANPGMGWQTFHTYADVDPDLVGLPSGSAYFRFTWKALEPTDGNIDFDLVQKTLSKARAAGQSLMFRVMTAGSGQEYAPDWLASAGCKLMSYQHDGGASVSAPDLDDPTCWARFEKLITELGKKLGTEPDLQIDIGGVGLWGEWHFSGTTPQIPLPSWATRKKVVDLHQAAFPQSPQTALIGNVEALTYATSLGAGWRADCLGDLGFFSSTWNHMDDMYKQHVQEAQAQNAWQKGPVAWESCGTMQDWVSKGYDVHSIFQYALELHGSFVNNKSAALPAGAQHRTEVEWLLERLGYRLVLRSLTHDEKVTPGGSLAVSMSWENLGVAPPYHPFELVVGLFKSSDADPTVLTLDSDVRSWLPGTVEVTQSLPLPSSLQPGTWQLAVGIKGTPGQPMLNLAIEGRDGGGWYPLSSVVVE